MHLLPKLSKHDLHCVRENLGNLYASFHFQSSERTPIVPSLRGHRLYHTRAGWGRVLKAIYPFLQRYFNINPEERLAHILKDTHRRFHKLLNLTLQHEQTYQSFLNQLSNSSQNPPSARDIARARKQLRRFYYSTFPFLSLEKHGNPALKTYLAHYLSDHPPSTQSFFYSPPSYHSLKGSIRLISLEGETHQQLPLAHLKQLLNTERCDLDNPDKVVKIWAAALNKSKRITQRFLHKALFQIATIAGESERTSLLAMHLSANGYAKLRKADPKHDLWRKQLTPHHAVLSFPNFKYPLRIGNDVANTSCGDNNALFYEAIQNDSPLDHCFIMVGPNTLYLKLRDTINAHYGWGIRSKDYINIDPKGCFALVERLKPLHQGIANADQDYLHKNLKDFFQLCIKNGITPNNLSVDHLGFSKSGELKSMVDFEISSKQDDRFDFCSLETLAYICSRSNLKVYIDLMDALKEAPQYPLYKEFYERMVRQALSKKITDKLFSPHMGAWKKEIDDPNAFIRGRELYEAVFKLKQESYQLIAAQNPTAKSKKINDFLAKNILSFYKDSKAIGRLWFNLQPKNLLEKWQQKQA